MIRNIAYSIEAEAHSDYVMRLLMELEKYAEFHFYSEENVMISCGYPDLARHQQEHRQLMVDLGSKIALYRTGGTDASNVLDFLVEWFLTHATGEDKKLAAYIQKELESGGPDFLVSGDRV